MTQERHRLLLGLWAKTKVTAALIFNMTLGASIKSSESSEMSKKDKSVA